MTTVLGDVTPQPHRRPGAARQSSRRAASHLELGNGRLHMAATQHSEWIEYRAALARKATEPTPWRVLEINRTLPALARLTLDDAGHLCLRADQWTAGGAGPDHIAPAFEAAHHALGGELELLAEPVPPDEESWARWPRAAAELGWTVSLRSGQRCLVDLDVPTGFHQATVAALGQGIRAFVSLLRLSLAPEPREAIGRFLLSATDDLRLVRAASFSHRSGSDDAAAIELEVALAPNAIPDDLDRALAALSVACRHVSREVQALAEGPVARRFLESTQTEE